MYNWLRLFKHIILNDYIFFIWMQGIWKCRIGLIRNYRFLNDFLDRFGWIFEIFLQIFFLTNYFLHCWLRLLKYLFFNYFFFLFIYYLFSFGREWSFRKNLRNLRGWFLDCCQILCFSIFYFYVVKVVKIIILMYLRAIVVLLVVGFPNTQTIARKRRLKLLRFNYGGSLPLYILKFNSFQRKHLSGRWSQWILILFHVITCSWVCLAKVIEIAYLDYLRSILHPEKVLNKNLIILWFIRIRISFLNKVWFL